jgi:hypothetical protein
MYEYLVYWPNGTSLLVSARHWLSQQELRMAVDIELQNQGKDKTLADLFVRVDIAIPAPFKATPLQMWEAIVYGNLTPDAMQKAWAELDSPLP